MTSSISEHFMAAEANLLHRTEESIGLTDKPGDDVQITVATHLRVPRELWDRHMAALGAEPWPEPEEGWVDRIAAVMDSTPLPFGLRVDFIPPYDEA